MWRARKRKGWGGVAVVIRLSCLIGKLEKSKIWQLIASLQLLFYFLHMLYSVFFFQWSIVLTDVAYLYFLCCIDKLYICVLMNWHGPIIMWSRQSISKWFQYLMLSIGIKQRFCILISLHAHTRTWIRFFLATGHNLLSSVPTSPPPWAQYSTSFTHMTATWSTPLTPTSKLRTTPVCGSHLRWWWTS